MQVSTKVFNDKALANFADTSQKIQDTQSRISSGKNLLRASDDPVAAANISVAKDKLKDLSQFDKNIDKATGRLELCEISMTEMQNICTRIYELSLMSANDTYNATDRQTVKAEILSLKEMMIALANTKDMNGDAIFAGYKSNIIPFVADESGTVAFNGSQGTSMVQISETQKTATSINGSDAFMRVPTDNGYKDIFSIVDDLTQALDANTVNKTAVNDIQDATDHFGIKMTEIGSLINISDQQKSVIEKRIQGVTEDLSKMEDADLAQLVSTLQDLLLTRDASQQSFALIGQKSLFDYIRM
jgi:flagellar hook-associated protein 3 FlgL